jgi:hypothetical protein
MSHTLSSPVKTVDMPLFIPKAEKKKREAEEDAERNFIFYLRNRCE